ncbi:DUF6262 family protein [Thalassolituus sp.]|uniref:DUF6262 family protein n=1 Tax=Thalassolituus sp. TaxID=2030822 RepID=UPI0035184ED3
MHEEKTRRLNDFNRQLKESNKEKIIRVIDQCLRQSEEINISKIASKSGLSRQTIYRSNELRDLIDRYRETSVLRKNRSIKTERETMRENSYKAKNDALRTKIKGLQSRIACLKDENQKLRDYIERLES